MLGLDGFKEAVLASWSFPLLGDPMAILIRKLQMVKKNLIDLNNRNGNVHNAINDDRLALSEIQSEIFRNSNYEELLLQEMDATNL